MTELVHRETGELLALPDAEISATALVLGDDLSVEDWTALGHRLARMTQGVQWWVGDWWAYGETRYGDRARAVAESNRWKFQTFANAGSVARRFETSRRREVLPWSHHAEVMSLDVAAADVLLDAAEENDWSVRDLRREVKALRRKTRTAEVASRAAEVPQGIEVRHEDCLTLIASIPDGSVSLLLTDPPYAVTENDWDTWESEEDYWGFMAEWLEAMRPKMASEFTAFVFCDADASPMLYDLLRSTSWPVLRQAIWHRPNLAKKRAGSATFLSAYEPFWHAGTRALILPEEWGEERFDVQRFVVPQSTHTQDTAYHPTQKPLDLMRRLVQVGSAPGEFVVDPFCGAGTTAVACRDEGRACLTGDTDEGYVQVARGRLA